MTRKLALRIAIYGLLIAAFLLWRSRHDGVLRCGLPLALATVGVGLWIAAKERHRLRIAILILPFFALLPFALPGRDLDRERLMKRYLSSMRDFEGTRYVWGGENSRGIDCSGLPRRALRDGLFEQALRGNGRAARMWLDHWWHDTSAKAMGEGYRGFTRPTGVAGPLWEMDLARMEPGDLAVTRGGSHVMVHLGGGDWIQADPGPGKVIMGRPDQADNPWFRCDVSIFRWTVFE